MRACREFRAALGALVECDLALERRLELERHARACADCAARLARERALQEALIGLSAPPLESLDVQRNVRVVLERLERGPRTLPRARPRRWWIPLAAAAALCLASWLAARLVREAPMPAPPVAQGPREPALPRAEPVVPAHVSEPAAPEAPQTAAAELERERLERARANVRSALLESAPDFDPSLGEGRAYAAAVDESIAALAREGWPVATLVESLAAGEDDALATRALRWLGAHGSSSVRLRAALARGERAPSAVSALLDLGASGVEELRRAPDSPALRALVLERLERANVPAAASWLEDALVRPRLSAEERRGLLDALCACGAQGVPGLVRLASRGTLEAEELLARLAGIEGADGALGRVLVEGRTSGLDEELLLRAVAAIGVREGWEWVEREARDGLHAESALAALARGTPEALAVLLHLRASGSTDADDLQRTLELVLREHPGSAAELAQRGTRTELAELVELLLGAPSPALVPTALELATSELLPESDRRWMLLVVCEQGRPGDVRRLLELFPRLRERTLQAAGLLALHALGGEEALEPLLAKRPASVRRRILAALGDPADRGRNLTTLARLARAIEGSLPTPLP